MICMACDGRNVAARGRVPVLYMFRTRATIQHCKRKRIISTLGTAELLAEPQLGTGSVALRNNRHLPPYTGISGLMGAVPSARPKDPVSLDIPRPRRARREQHNPPVLLPSHFCRRLDPGRGGPPQWL